MKLLINGLSIGTGGGYTVGKMLFLGLASSRPDWELAILLSEGNVLHEEMRQVLLPVNACVFWAPSKTSERRERIKYEKNDLLKMIEINGINCLLQLNGMISKEVPIPTFCHYQDPWPFRPEAWSGLADRLIAFIKRRSIKKSLKIADGTGWTSEYLRSLVLGKTGVSPRRAVVSYNGVPDEWLEYSKSDSLLSLHDRPNRFITISTVSHYKRQWLVVRAVAQLVHKYGMKDVEYRIAGYGEMGDLEKIQQLSRDLNVADNVFIEGRVSDERIVELYESAKCFCLMSVCESFGIPAIEAMARGVPVVVGDCCAIPEICGDAANLVPVDDVDILAEKIYNVLNNKRVAEDSRRKGFDNVRRFGWSGVCEAIATEIDEIV